MADKEQKSVANRALSLVMDQINGVRGKNKSDIIKIGFLGDMKALDVPVIPTGSLALDAATGVGGYPQGRIIEIFGPESSGKSTLCLHAIAQAQAMGMKCAYIDVEHTLDVAYAKKLDVNVDDLLFAQPNDGDEAMRIIDALVRSGQIGLIILDSVASLVTGAEMEKEITDNNIGTQARLMSQALKRLTVLCGKSNTTLLLTNQIRMKVGGYGNPETTSGGQALKFYATLRLDVRRREPIKDGDEVIGSNVKVHVIKNKVARPFKQAFFNIMYGMGIDKDADIVATAADFGFITRAGAWYSYRGQQVAQGMERTIEYVKEHPEILPELRGLIMAKLQEGKLVLPEVEPEETDELGHDDG